MKTIGINDVKAIPYFAHEGAMARMERTIKRQTIAIIVAVVLGFLTNALWLYVFTQYDFETYEYSQDGRGINIIGNENGVDYGAEIDSSNGYTEE